jgi:hypothetical protein
MQSSAARKQSPGRPAKFDWDSFWIEVCRFLLDEGPPDTQAKFVKHMQDWASTRFLEEPSEPTIRRKLSRLWTDLRLRDFAR